MTVRREITESPRETGARRPEASPPIWRRETRRQACRSGEYAIAAEVLMNNVGDVNQVSAGSLIVASSRSLSGFIVRIWYPA
jgi:hypothetical protein